MSCRVSLRSLLFFLIVWATPLALPVRADDWPPIPPEELALKDSPTHPGSHAIILYREEITNDDNSTILYHMRIKILTEEGKEYANIELPFLKNLYKVKDIKARTIQPDGTWVEFEGDIFERTVVKARGVKVLAKTFSLPDVQVGSIIEYTYKEQWDETRIPSRRWTIQHELPTLKARFARKPYRGLLGMNAISLRLPNGHALHMDKDGWARLELENIPPFQEEEYMPPRDELNMRVDFYYRLQNETRDEFWKRIGKSRYEAAERFIGKHKDIAKEVTDVVLPDDPPETKLHKLYARAQQIRNLNYERSKTEKEEEREKLKDNNNVKDVLKHGYGYGWEINCLFVALARAAGFDASVAYLSARNQYFFNADYLDEDQLNAYVTVVQLGSQQLFLDPASMFAPYGLLSWPQTGVQGLLLDKDGGTWIKSAQPMSNQAVVHRLAKLDLLDDGTLQGELQVTFTGLEAYDRRTSVYQEDDAGRQKEIEDEIKEWLPPAATLEIEKIDDWESTEEPLRVECHLTIPGFAASTGRRLLLPAAVFQVGGRHPFQHATRLYPVYFHYPFQEADDITIKLPEGFRVESLPKPRETKTPFAALETRRTQQSEDSLHIKRHLIMEGYFYRANYYPMLRSFYDTVRSADEERLVLQSAETAQRQ